MSHAVFLDLAIGAETRRRRRQFPSALIFTFSLRLCQPRRTSNHRLSLASSQAPIEKERGGQKFILEKSRKFTFKTRENISLSSFLQRERERESTANRAKKGILSPIVRGCYFCRELFLLGAPEERKKGFENPKENHCNINSGGGRQIPPSRLFFSSCSFLASDNAAADGADSF